MNLTETPEEVNWPAMYYAFVEGSGPFFESAPKCWTQFNKDYAPIIKSNDKNNVKAVFSQYKLKPEMIYRAGMGLETEPEVLPEGLRCEHFAGGKYAKFTLVGSYSNLPQACGRVFAIAQELRIEVRDGFYIENYVNDPKETPEDQLITEILFPIV